MEKRNAPVKSLHRRTAADKEAKTVFSHPDYTVGFGIAPNRPPEGGSQTLLPVGNRTPP